MRCAFLLRVCYDCYMSKQNKEFKRIINMFSDAFTTDHIEELFNFIECDSRELYATRLTIFNDGLLNPQIIIVIWDTDDNLVAACLNHEEATITNLNRVKRKIIER